MAVLLDTNILFASASARDVHHTPAREIVRGIKYLYSFDDDFDAVSGISRLPTADNPFD